MNKVFVRSALIVAAVIAVMVIAGAQQVSYADMGDRSPAGSIPIKADGVVSVPENQDVKLNFGTEYIYDDYYYFKIVPSKTGIIKFVDDFTHSNVVRCNEKKKIVSSGSPDYGDFFSWDSSYKYQTYINYGVKKGKTYLIRVKGASTVREKYGSPYIGSVKWTNTKVKASKYGKSQKKAVKIKRNKTIKGVIQAGSKKAQWYKVKLKGKKAKVYMTTKGTCGTIIAEVRYKSYGRWNTGRMHVDRHTDYHKDSGVFTSNKKGSSFYIKVFPDKKTSGTYTLKWK